MTDENINTPLAITGPTDSGNEGRDILKDPSLLQTPGSEVTTVRFRILIVLRVQFAN